MTGRDSSYCRMVSLGKRNALCRSFHAQAACAPAPSQEPPTGRDTQGSPCMSSSGESGWLWPKELQLSLPFAQPCSPVLWPPVVQPAGPAGEAEHGVEGAFQAVQCPLWGQQGQCQGQHRDTSPAQHCPALGLAQKTGNQLIPSPARHKVTSHNVVATGTRTVSISTLGGKRNISGIQVGPGKAKLLPSPALPTACQGRISHQHICSSPRSYL